MEKIRGWYNGYTFNNEEEKIYNPFSIIRYLERFAQSDTLIA